MLPARARRLVLLSLEDGALLDASDPQLDDNSDEDEGASEGGPSLKDLVKVGIWWP